MSASRHELTVGDEWYVGGVKFGGRQGVSDRFIIPPFNVAIIRTGERLAIPRFLIARWNIRVALAYRGLLWVGAAQVDAGFRGYLCCPIYNLSDSDIELQVGQELAVIDFVKTTKFDSDNCIRYKIPKRVIIEDYNPHKLESALSSRLEKDIGEFRKELTSTKNDLLKKVDENADDVRRNERHIATFSSGMFTVVAILVALMGLFIGVKDTEFFIVSSSPFFIFSVLAFSVFAFTSSIFNWFIRRGSLQRGSWQLLSVLAGVFALAVAFIGFNFTDKNYKEEIKTEQLLEIGKLRNKLQNQINELQNKIGK